MASKVKTISAPVGGWNARDSWASMKETDAVLLDNWFPMEGAVRLRKGYTSHQTGLGDWVDSLMVYNDGNNARLLAAANGHIRNVTSGTTSLGSGYANDLWYYAQLDGTMGLVNGADAPKTYNGSTISSMTLSGTGLTTTSVIGVNVFKSRSYFWMSASQSMWYSALNTMGGTTTEFKLGRVGNITGYLVAMANITVDGGLGIDDLAAFIFSSGDVVVYQGSDPGDAALWSLVGLYRMPAPVGRRCVIQYRGDVLVLTTDGVISLTSVMQGRTSEITGKIDQAITSAVASGSSLTGWEMCFFPAGNMLIINVPTSTSLMNQFVMNTNTGAWCRFKDINARSWAVFNGLLYYGGSGVVNRAWYGTTDNGSAISCDAVPAFSFFGSNRLKQVTAVQPSLTANGALDVGIRTEKDYSLGSSPSANLSTGTSDTLWGSAWGSPWSRGAESYSPFKSVTKVGRALSARIATTTKNHDVSWFATTYFYTEGGFI